MWCTLVDTRSWCTNIIFTNTDITLTYNYPHIYVGTGGANTPCSAHGPLCSISNRVWGTGAIIVTSV